MQDAETGRAGAENVLISYRHCSQDLMVSENLRYWCEILDGAGLGAVGGIERKPWRFSEGAGCMV